MYEVRTLWQACSYEDKDYIRETERSADDPCISVVPAVIADQPPEAAAIPPQLYVAFDARWAAGQSVFVCNATWLPSVLKTLQLGVRQTACADSNSVYIRRLRFQCKITIRLNCDFL